ncbi:thyrotropin-releasing hormone receptor-like [Dreissena polymorpha]|uniref:thyrotropin-releasing hormone receptor-like n=1 Tax=Dreissena polymorpha TaxID=45954 RepID=UPI002264FB39|nr:thyrotropin-releasing hormone receptor-like [Dreissena polymorpha]
MAEKRGEVDRGTLGCRLETGHRDLADEEVVAPSVTDFSESNYINPSRLANENMKNSETPHTLTIKVRSESATGTSVGNHGGSGPILTSRATISTVSFAPITHSGEATNSSTKRSHSRPQGIKNASIQTTRIAFLVCAVFVISWLPPWICFFLATKPSFLANPTVVRFMLFGKMTYLLNTVVNPFVYPWFNRKFRQQLNELFRCNKK